MCVYVYECECVCVCVSECLYEFMCVREREKEGGERDLVFMLPIKYE